ncbi:RagB/SusD family nutrient uptake outer membrane protein [Fulvitalea axinellae]
MKRYTNIIVLFLAFSISSCQDWINVEPQNSVVLEDFWKSKDDIESALAGTYVELREPSDRFLLWGEILRSPSFEIGGNNTGSIVVDAEKIMRLQITSENIHSDWNGLYKIIHLANNVIKYAPTVRDNDLSLSEKELNAYLSEAYFIRSLCYYYLVRTFKDIPFPLEPSDTDDIEFFLPKTDDATILDKLIEDMEWAERYAPKSFANIEYDKGRATKAAAQALLADLYLWVGRYDDCLLMCDKLINQSSHALLPGDRWFQIFSKGNTNEGIFEIQYDASRSQSNVLSTWMFNNIGSRNSAYVLREETLELYDKTDARGEGKTFMKDNLTLWKYIGLEEDNSSRFRTIGNNDANIILYRYADILLMKAEALVEKGDFFAAQAEYNKIRDRANLPSKIFPNDRHIAEDLILEERTREFIGEGKRWFDILRFAKRNDFERKQMLIDILTANVDPQELPKWKSLLSNPMGYYLPIHYDEVRNNSKLEQNPYYAR